MSVRWCRSVSIKYKLNTNTLNQSQFTLFASYKQSSDSWPQGDTSPSRKSSTKTRFFWCHHYLSKSMSVDTPPKIKHSDIRHNRLQTLTCTIRSPQNKTKPSNQSILNTSIRHAECSSTVSNKLLIITHRTCVHMPAHTLTLAADNPGWCFCPRMCPFAYTSSMQVNVMTHSSEYTGWSSAAHTVDWEQSQPGVTSVRAER